MPVKKGNIKNEKRLNISPGLYQPRYKICVSGAAETGHCSSGALEMAQEVGREIARRGFVLVTGATTGIPHWAAKGAKEAGGAVIGLSPAVSEVAHVKSYHLPLDYHDLIIYTGFDYSGRNLLLTRSSDAVIVICGRMGTLNEFTISFEDRKPIGVLEGSGGMADMLKEIVNNAHRGPGKVVFSPDPKKLLDMLVEMMEKEKAANGII
ncbi:MAG: LOG family protein [Parcubacteria group bacterium]|nr:LOG family protein [Parcubacteria group bacterium]